METKTNPLKKLGFGSLAALALVLFALSAQAKEYDLYVDASNTTGTEDGTSDNPYNTITEALDAASAGDAILVKNGTYTENIEVPTDVEVYGEDKSDVIIDGGSDGTTVKLNHKSKLKKVTVKGGDTGIKVPEKAGVKISKVKVKDADHNGIILEGDSKTRSKEKYEREITDCTIEDNGARGIYVKKSRLVLEDSDIIDNEEEGVDLRKGVKATIKHNTIKSNDEGNLEFKIDKAKLKIKSNTIKKAKASGINAQSYQGSGGEIFITKNKIKDNKKYGLRCSVQNHKPAGSWSSQLFLSENTYSGNEEGNYSPVCGF